MGLLSLAIWTPIFFGVVLLALGRALQDLEGLALERGAWERGQQHGGEEHAQRAPAPLGGSSLGRAGRQLSLVGLARGR